jgi:serine/threonine protein phosphatase PrpC
MSNDRMSVDLTSAGETHVGPRPTNQDCFHADVPRRVFVVADGMGGYLGGEVASCLAVETFTRFVTTTLEDEEATWRERPIDGTSPAETVVQLGIELADLAVRQRQRGDLYKMGCTLATLVIDGSGRAIIGHVGDSRVYRARNGQVSQVTRDHTAYEELLAAG